MKISNTEGCTSGMRSILCNSEFFAKNLYSILSSKLYRFYNDYQKTSGFNTFVFNFTKLDINTKWNDNDIYHIFKLTESEISLVENYINKK